jgi:catechol 2,3-dioxygenase-like lactoylglutathione lyase family enzyme
VVDVRKEVAMGPNSFYPVLFTDDVAKSGAFYIDFLGFTPTFESDWYLSLVHKDAPAYQLALIARTHESIPAGAAPMPSKLILNFEVADATKEYWRLQEAGLPIAQPLRDEPWGQRHFVVLGPDGVLIDIIENIPATPEYAAQYTQPVPMTTTGAATS